MHWPFFEPIFLIHVYGGCSLRRGVKYYASRNYRILCKMHH